MIIHTTSVGNTYTTSVNIEGLSVSCTASSLRQSQSNALGRLLNMLATDRMIVVCPDGVTRDRVRRKISL